ncbi:MAG TPA: S8 family peptidase [Acidimicrobiia bacterium]|nr:S8 family peptidase [Acidimicrobiia bacterium]
MFLVFLVSLSLFPVASPPETVLVKDEVAPLSSPADSVLGWRRVPVGQAPQGAETVPNVRLSLLDHDPDDEPFGPDQWALGELGVARAWHETTGGSRVIAVIDSGVLTGHPDLADRIFTNIGETPGNDVDDDGNGLVDDVHGWDLIDGDNDPTDPSQGHGTEVAGVAAASLNGVGVAGIAPTATILPIRACTNSCELFTVAWAVTYATDMGAEVINLSLGGFASEAGPLADAVSYAEEAGVLVVAAAGNTGTNIDGTSFVPADLPNPNLVAVAATDRHNRLWAESNFGPNSVELAAPGVEIVTTTLDSLGGYRTVTGTSFAAPHVSATAALMLSVNPALTPTQLIDRLGRHGLATADLQGTTVHGTRLRTDTATVSARLTDIDGVFEADIVWMALEDLTSGCNPPTNDRYCPDDPVTRGQMAAFLHRALDLSPGPDTFADDTDSIYQTHINALAHAGITRGCNPPANDRYCPDDSVSRAEMAAFLHRAGR